MSFLIAIYVTIMVASFMSGFLGLVLCAYLDIDIDTRFSKNSVKLITVGSVMLVITAFTVLMVMLWSWALG